MFPPGKSPGSRSGHSASSLPTGSTGKASATTYPARGDTDFLELVIDAALPLPLYWATRDGVHIFPDPNRIAEIQRLMTDTWPMMSLVSVVALIPVEPVELMALSWLINRSNQHGCGIQIHAKYPHISPSSDKPIPRNLNIRLKDLDRLFLILRDDDESSTK